MHLISQKEESLIRKIYLKIIIKFYYIFLLMKLSFELNFNAILKYTDRPLLFALYVKSDIFLRLLINNYFSNNDYMEAVTRAIRSSEVNALKILINNSE